MNQPSESFKIFANRVAEAVATEDGSRATRLLQLIGLMGPIEAVGAYDPSLVPTEDPETSGRVGVWDRRDEDGQAVFVRSVEQIEDWNYWANVGRIAAKGSRRRVVFIGESVARGYLYDPQFTPAMALSRILETELGDDIEVIDLARTNLGLEVRELALAALQLDPDVVVIFSGNNWSFSFPPTTEELALIDTALRAEGIGGLKRFIEEQLEGNVQRLVGDVSRRFEERGVPLVWMIPEFNLGDWRDPITNAPHLSTGDNRLWVDAWQEARAALDEGDDERAAAAAERMVELDGGISIAGLYILAECCQRRGDLEGVARHLEQARDAVIWDPSRSTSPRTYEVARRTLRKTLEGRPDRLVDVPEVFAEYLEGSIPDRRMFLDYCHLTSEGILVAMAAAASAVIGALATRDIPWRQLVDLDLAPPASVEGEAAFLAAIHNAHWWQSYDLVHHYCRHALEQSPEIAEVMTRFLDLQTRRAPMLMCRAAQEIVDLGSPLIQHYLLRYNNQQLDRLLLDAVVAALDSKGIAAAETLGELRQVEHGLPHRTTNLLDYYYNSAALQPQEVMWVVPRRQGHVRRKENDYYKAYWLESRFVFIAEAGCAIELELTCRLPSHAADRGGVAVVLNGEAQGEMQVGGDWETWDISLDSDAVIGGLNELTLRWPMPDFPDETELKTVIDDLVDGVFPEFFCSFGEIHTLIATAASPAREAAVD